MSARNPSNHTGGTPQHEPESDGKGLCAAHPVEPPLSRAFWRVMRAVMFSEHPNPDMDALPLAQMRLLWTIFHSPRTAMKELSDRMGVSQSTVTQLADRLVRRGLVERHAVAEDRRVVLLRLSQVGEHLLTQDVQRNRETMQAIWNALAESERHTVVEGLDTLARIAEQVRAAQGIALPEWPDSPANEETNTVDETTQPVLDLMTRRIRGKN